MNLLPGTTPKTFSLLSIGQRGVGKTVFLSGSYAELHSDSQLDHSKQLWFDCQDSDVQEKIERILSYVAQTSLYPPATIKITNFNFSLKRHSLWGAKTLCHFRWWDIPGESCNIRTLLSELSRPHNFPYPQDLSSGLTQSLFIGQILPPTTRWYISILVLVSVLLGVIPALFFGLFTLDPEQGPSKEQPHGTEQQSGAAQ